MPLELTPPEETLIPMDELTAYLGDDVEEGPNLDLAARAVTELFRNYCGRILNHSVADFILYDVIATKRIMTGLWPLHELEDTSESLGDDPQIEYASGGVSRSDGCHICGDINWRISSGYLQIPADMTMAYVSCVRDKWNEFVEGNSAEGLDVSSVSVPDVGTIRYSNPNQAIAQLRAYHTDPVLMHYIGVLEPYRAGVRVGAG